MLRYDCIFGQAVEQAFTVGNHPNWQVFLLPLVGDSSLPTTASHNMAGVYSARSRASRHAIASTPKVEKMVLLEALLFQLMKESGVASVGS